MATDSSQVRNILIIGKTGAGKASIANAIVDRQLFDIGVPMKRCCNRKQNKDIKDESNLKIALVNISSTQDDQPLQLQESISKAFTKLKPLSLILFVLKCEPFDEQLWANYVKATSCLGQNASTITAVCVTWCDLMNDDAKTKVQKNLDHELQACLPSVNLITFAQKGIHMVSLPQLNDIPTDMRSFVEEKKKISTKNLQNLLLQAGEPYEKPPGTSETEQATESTILPQTTFSETRNILIFGQVGAGKSTVANAILGSDAFNVGKSIQSTTRQAEMPIVHGVVKNDCKFNVALVDTVSVAGSRASGKYNLQDRMKEGITKIESVNLILFVSKLERHTNQEKDSFEEVMKHLRSSCSQKTLASAVTAFVVTCCEQKSEEAREEIKHELRMSTTVTQFAQKGIFLVGLPNLDEVPERLRQHHQENRKRDEEKLKSLTIASKQKVSFNQAEGKKIFCR